MESKITIIGDIMCEPLMLKAAKKTGETYDFNDVFSNVKQLFSESDYVIGNLETPLAGKKAKYVSELYKFNAPDDFAKAIKNAGIDMVLTANNHCLDRGLDGMIRTIQVLDQVGIAHTGSFDTYEDRTEAAYFKICECTIAIVSYTYGTNYAVNDCFITSKEEELINLLYPVTERISAVKSNPQKRASRLKKKLITFIKRENIVAIKKKLHMEYNSAYADDYFDAEKAEPYLRKMEKDILEAKQKADIVLFCPHVGGQFNVKPGRFTEYVFSRAIRAGCDAIIASHPHIVQKAVCGEKTPCFYSLGNFCMSPNSVYLVHDQKPEYGIAVHFYIENKEIRKITFSILRIIETKEEMLTVYPIDVLYPNVQVEEQIELENDINMIYSAVTGRKMEHFAIQPEYVL